METEKTYFRSGINFIELGGTRRKTDRNVSVELSKQFRKFCSKIFLGIRENEAGTVWRAPTRYFSTWWWYRWAEKYGLMKVKWNII